ncbi:hypothetical protein VC83_02052 [Pseudogymnoascus destructans]|uniref:ACB domain-containing protein n=2 Tax=Pseudogymnoascus destructans TaxID=655981 RepID=L8FT49_PSED2|nr:uncharacterized protein VC83_02052 [Pseudogymnoascus destructans]ELR04130.1 hypothetical protein GMDG_01434 [Pseudogymnoascus destructans 20631-21]OAF61635.1 hypothetical protein VC83_02052 [Pseudogymnoascus destructans]
MSGVTLSPAFNQAVMDSKKLVNKPTKDHLLEMYGLFKQATQDPPIEKSEAPGAFDLKGKAKKRAWQKVVDKGVTPEQAQEQYIALIEQLKATYEFDESKVPEAVGGQ